MVVGMVMLKVGQYGCGDGYGDGVGVTIWFWV